MWIRRALVALIVGALMSVAAPAHASQAKPQYWPKDHVVLHTTAKITSNGQTRVVDRHSGNLVSYRSTGTGGTSESSGCKTLTLINTGKSWLFRTVLFRYITHTAWCFTRSVKTTYNHEDTWEFPDPATGVSWQGQVGTAIKEAYYWNGSKWGGYRHYRKGSFKMLSPCFNIGCDSYAYPANDARVHSDGTWWYAVTGADS